jgi:ribonuclease R
MLSDSAILKKIAGQPKATAGYKQLVRELGLHGEERRLLGERLKKMVERGEVVQADSGYALPKTSGRNLVTGRLTMHRDGYGFVIPDRDSLPEGMRDRLTGDIFVPPHTVGSAMHGDRVLVEVGPIRPDGRAEGRILRTVGRAHATVVGTFHYGQRYNYVTPIDEKITQDVVIPRGMERPELISAEDAESSGRKGKKNKGTPHRVLGAEAARDTRWDDLESRIVDVEITEWPTPTQNPRGRVIEIVGNASDFGVDVEIIIRKFHIPHRFPPEVLAEAEAAPAVISKQELRRRRDYRHLPIVTIDGETARDFDDAVTVYRLENGDFELQVHIADVAHYVRPGSAIDQEARLRGTSVYFPDRAVPMLPLELSTDLCSLRPQVDRLVLSCTMEIDARGEIVGYEINEGVIRSAQRMTYTDVNAILEGDPALRRRYHDLVGTLELMRDLSAILYQKRQRRGSIDFDLPEPVIEFDERGMMKGVSRSERNIAHRLIEEFMLSANECVAQYLENKAIASLYRIHEKPDAKRVYEFEVLAAGFGYSLGVGALPIQRMQMKADRRASYGTGKRAREVEIPQEVHITPRMYQKLTQKIAGKPEERILSFLMLRSLKQARYSEENVGHFALAAPTYTHFTSPIRRYPDLIVHRILKAVLADSAERSHGEVPVGTSAAARGPHSEARAGRAREGRRGTGAAGSPWSKRLGGEPQRTAQELSGPIPLNELHDIAEESSQAERRADEAERELMEWKKVQFMEERLGEDFDGLIISVTRFGFFVELTELFIEGLVPIGTLTGDRFVYHENTRQIIGQRSRKTYSLGDRVRVLVDRIDPVAKKIQFAVVEEQPATKRR